MKTIKNLILEPIKKRPLLFSIIGAVLVIGFFLFRGGDDPVEAAAYHQVQRGDFLVSIIEGGTLEAVNEVVVRNELEGNSRIIFLIPEGTYVTNNQLLVQFDSGDAEDQLNQQQISYEKSLASYIAATNNLLITKSTADSDIRAAELSVKFAKMDLDKFDQLEAEYQKRNAEMDITTAESALEVAQEKLKWSKELNDQGFETKRNVDIDQLDVTRKSLDKEKMQTNYKMLTDYDLQKQREQYNADWEEAQKELDRIKKQAESKITQAQADVRSELNTLMLNSNKLEKVKRQMSATKLFAPQPGIVVYPEMRGRFSSESMVEEGATSRYRQELIKLPDISKMKVEVKVHESHVNQVSVGQPAFVVLDAMPDQRFRGRVTRVAPLPDAQQRWMNPDLKVYSTDITIQDQLPEEIKPGVSARAEIVITNLTDVIKVPIQSVTTLKGQTVCFVKDGGDSKPVPVDVGMFNNKFIEIKSGLKAGDLVLLAPPFDAENRDLGGEVISEDENIDLTPQPVEPATSNQSERNSQETSRQPDSADQTASGPGRGFGGGFGGDNSERRAQMLQQFDQDGDGELSESERAAMREQFGNRGGQRGGNFDREEFMKRFDVNGDGEIDDSEREAMRQQFGGRRGGRSGE